MADFKKQVVDFLVDRSQSVLEEVASSKMADFQHVSPPPDLADLEWVAYILISFQKASICYKAYYAPDTFRKIVTETLQLDKESNDDNIKNFIKEYCNRVGGSLKSSLQEALQLGADGAALSAPESLDIIESTANVEKDTRFWSLKTEAGQYLVCECVFSIPENFEFNEKIEISSAIMDSEGEIDFF